MGMNTANTRKLIWIDLEMTGLDPLNHTIIEIAIVITDANLNIVAKSESMAISATKDELSYMDDWCQNQHTKSGLLKRVSDTDIIISKAESKMLDFIKKYVDKGESPMCGNSVHQDRRFMQKYMPNLEDFFHYRNIDVSTIKELAGMWSDNHQPYKKPEAEHLALSDIIDSINELKHYRKVYFNI